jgi:transposase
LAAINAPGWNPYEAALKALLTEHPSMTLQEQRDWLKEAYELETSVSAVARFVCQIGYRYKKNGGRQ